MPNTLERVTAAAAGELGGLEARVKGLTGVFVTLTEEHRQVATLLSRASNTSEPPERRELWKEIKRQLLSHERAELSEVYPVLATLEAGKAIAQRHGEGAGEVERALSEIDVCPFDSPAWTRGMGRLVEAVERHVAEEEGELFPQAQEVLGEDRARRLEEPFLREKRRQEDLCG